MGARPRYGDDPVLTRATLRAAAGVGSATAVTGLFLALSVLLVGAKFGLYAAFHGGGGAILWGFGELHWWGAALVFLAVVALVTVVQVRRRPTRVMPRGVRPLPDPHPARDSLVRLASLADMPVPELLLVDSDQPNAFVVDDDDRPVAIVVTTAALTTLSPDELEAVLAHELFHVAHGDTGLTQRLEQLATVAQRKSPGPVARYVLRSVRTMSRQRELSADRAAALLTGRPSVLLRAVETCSDATAAPSTDLRAVAGVGFVPMSRPEHDVRTHTHPTPRERAEVLARVASSLGT